MSYQEPNVEQVSLCDLVVLQLVVVHQHVVHQAQLDLALAQPSQEDLHRD